MEQPVVIFDGVCNLCNATVDFIIKRDRDAVFQFAPNQSEAGEEIVSQANLDVFDADTLVLWEAGSTYVRSTAVLRIARRLGIPWRLAYGLIIIPRPIRDFFYRMLAKNRYRLFGKRDSCRVPAPEERTRFLQ